MSTETVRTCWCNQNPDLPVVLRYQCDECREWVQAQVDTQIGKRTR